MTFLLQTIHIVALTIRLHLILMPHFKTSELLLSNCSCFYVLSRMITSLEPGQSLTTSLFPLCSCPVEVPLSPLSVRKVTGGCFQLCLGGNPVKSYFLPLQIFPENNLLRFILMFHLTQVNKETSDTLLP